MEKIKAAFAWARVHKVRVMAVAAAVGALIAQRWTGAPVGEALQILGALLGA